MNLLPSCSMCNKYTRKSGGKGERFPLRENEFRASKPGEEKREKCLLIHPAQDKDPSAHFDIVRETGYLKALDDRGTATIEVGGAKFAMYTKNDGAWIKNAAEESRMLETMRKGAATTSRARRAISSGRGML